MTRGTALVRPADEGAQLAFLAVMLEMTPVASHSVAEIGYDPVVRDLHIRFHRAPTRYVYRGVPPDLYSRLLTSESKGAFVNTEIKGKYPFDTM